MLPPQAGVLALQPNVLALQPIAVAPRLRQLFAQAEELFLLLPDQLVAVVRRTRALVGHTRFMAESRKKYKSEFGKLTGSPAKRRRTAQPTKCTCYGDRSPQMTQNDRLLWKTAREIDQLVNLVVIHRRIEPQI